MHECVRGDNGPVWVSCRILTVEERANVLQMLEPNTYQVHTQQLQFATSGQPARGCLVQDGQKL